MDNFENLPILADELDLPVLLPGTGPKQTKIPAKYSQWHNLASQLHVRSCAVHPISDNEHLWLATGGGILHWLPELNHYKRYTSEHGLPGNSVLAVAVDGNGQKWALTHNNKLYYLFNDQWLQYELLESIHCIQQGEDGLLWVADSQGLSAIESPQSEPKYVSQIKSCSFRALWVIDQNDIWICDSRGIYHFDERWHFKEFFGVLTLACRDGVLWLGTLEGLFRIDLNNKKTDLIIGEISGPVHAIYPCEKGVWAASCGKVGLVTSTHWSAIRGNFLDINVRITSLVPAGSDTVWIGSHTGLLQGWTNKSTQWRLTNSPPDVIEPWYDDHIPPHTFSNTIQALAFQSSEDRSVLWIGTTNGLFRLDLHMDDWTYYSQTGQRDIRAIVVEKENSAVWVANWQGGLRRLQGRVLLNETAKVQGPIIAMTHGARSISWACGLNGLYKKDGEDWSIVLVSDALPSDGVVQAIAENTDEQILLGASTGLFIYELGASVIKRYDGVLGLEDIRSLLAVHNESRVFVGTANGLYGILGNQLKEIACLEDYTVTDLAWDKIQRVLWVGTDAGLYGLTEGKAGWKTTYSFTARNSGLAADRITAIAIDTNLVHESQLWIGTPCGLSCYTYQ